MLPDSVVIGSSTWRINRCHIPTNEHAYGICHAELHRIDIDKDLEDDHAEVTLTHELLHTAAHFVGLDESLKYTPEEIFGRIDNALHQILKANELFH